MEPEYVFWRDVFIAAIRRGQNPLEASIIAADALKIHKKLWLSKNIPEPEQPPTAPRVTFDQP